MATCFVCGERFGDLETMFAHIVSEHERGRDYIPCPLCKAPVRDVRSHWNARHQGMPMPKLPSMRARVWRQPSKDGGIKKAKPFHEGYFQSIKNDNKLHYRSGLELGIYEALELMPSVTKYYEEPFPIPYIFGGKSYRYYPDLLVEFADGHKELWEIKPKSQTKLAINLAKWDAANQYCRARRHQFKVITERGSSKLRRSVGLPARKKF